MYLFSVFCAMRDEYIPAGSGNSFNSTYSSNYKKRLTPHEGVSRPRAAAAAPAAPPHPPRPPCPVRAGEEAGSAASAEAAVASVMRVALPPL